MAERVSCRVDRGSAALAEDFARLHDDVDYWHVQGCDDCSGACFPPRLRCPHCGSDQMSWVPAGTGGTVASVVRVVGHNSRHRIPRPLRHLSEYATVIVTLAQWPGVRFPTLVVGAEAERCEVGDHVTLGRLELPDRTVATVEAADPS